jgi:dihydrofolate reductase
MPAHMIFGMAQSLDGYVANEAGDITLPVPEEALHRVFNENLRKAAVSLYGRRMYEVMRYWETADKDPDSKPWEIEFAKIWQRVPKVVVSTTLAEVGPNAHLIRGNVDEELKKLKAHTTGIIDVAGPTLAAHCTRLGLIDEYQLYFQPVVLGTGKPYFPEPPATSLRLTGVEQLPQEMVMLRYGPSAANGSR